MSTYVGGRCTYCRHYDLPCTPAVHGNPLFPYLSQTHNAVPINPGMGEPAVRMATPEPPKRTPADRARSLASVAIVVLMLCAALVAVGAVAVITGIGGTPAPAPIHYTVPPATPPTLPPPPTR